MSSKANADSQSPKFKLFEAFRNLDMIIKYEADNMSTVGQINEGIDVEELQALGSMTFCALDLQQNQREDRTSFATLSTFSDLQEVNEIIQSREADPVEKLKLYESSFRKLRAKILHYIIQQKNNFFSKTRLLAAETIIGAFGNEADWQERGKLSLKLRDLIMANRTADEIDQGRDQVGRGGFDKLGEYIPGITEEIGRPTIVLVGASHVPGVVKELSNIGLYKGIRAVKGYADWDAFVKDIKKDSTGDGSKKTWSKLPVPFLKTSLKL